MKKRNKITNNILNSKKKKMKLVEEKRCACVCTLSKKKSHAFKIGKIYCFSHTTHTFAKNKISKINDFILDFID